MVNKINKNEVGKLMMVGYILEFIIIYLLLNKK